MDATLLIADNDVRRRRELRRFFTDSGILTAAVASGLECLALLPAFEPDVLVIALEIPWGGGDGVIARLNDGLLLKKPLILVMGDAAVMALSARTGLPQGNCFSNPAQMERLLNRIGLEFAFRLFQCAENRRRRVLQRRQRVLIKEGVR
jgi:CheY-like chemotaxis protein